jgi:hypothetical protein
VHLKQLMSSEGYKITLQLGQKYSTILCIIHLIIDHAECFLFVLFFLFFLKIWFSAQKAFGGYNVYIRRTNSIWYQLFGKVTSIYITKINSEFPNLLFFFSPSYPVEIP